jgi:hypothetical protein
MGVTLAEYGLALGPASSQSSYQRGMTSSGSRSKTPVKLPTRPVTVATGNRSSKRGVNSSSEGSDRYVE